MFYPKKELEEIEGRQRSGALLPSRLLDGEGESALESGIVRKCKRDIGESERKSTGKEVYAVLYSASSQKVMKQNHRSFSMM